MKKSNHVQSLVRALELIELLNEKKELGVTEMGQALNLDKSTVYRLINTLRYKGYVRQNPRNHKYSNSLKLFEMGTAAVDRTGLIRRANPYLEYLAENTHETVNLALLEDMLIFYVDKIESTEVIKADLGIGKSYPAYSTSLGKAILAFMPDESVKALFRGHEFISFTPKTIKSLDELLIQLRIIRNRGYAYDDEELLQGLACIAAPVLNHESQPMAAISVAFPRYRYSKGSDEEKRIIELVCQTTKSLSEEFGSS